MKHYKSVILTSIMGLALVGCGGADSSSSGIDEFTSLNEKANFEYGYVSVDGIKTELSYLSALLRADSTGYTGYIGAFGENKTEQVLALSSSDGENPNFESIIVNIPSISDGYTCTNIDADEGSSEVIRDAGIYTIVAKDCEGRGSNMGKTKNVNIKLTQSVFSGGSSRIRIEGTKAYLETDYVITEDISIKGTGGLGTRAYNQIFDLIQNHPEVTTIVEGHISGSIHDDINMQTGRLIRKAGLSTHITSNSNISSGGVDLFCSGKKRTMEDGAKVGVHSWSGDGVEAGELPKDSPLHKNQIDYFTEMLGSPTGEEFYFYTIHAASAADIYQMSRAEMQAYKLLAE